MVGAEDQQQHVWELSDYLKVIRDRAWIIIVTVVVVAGAALAMSLSSTPLYRASSTLVYQTNDLDKTLFGSQVFSDADVPRDLQTAAGLVRVEQVAEGAQHQLNSARSPGELLNMISVTSSTDSNLVEIEAVGTKAQEAADVANAFAQQFILVRQESDRAVVAAARDLVKKQLDGLSTTDASSDYGLMLKEKYESLEILESMQTGGFSQVQSAAAASSPFSPRPGRTGIIALAVGLVAGLGLAFLVDHLDKRIKDTKTLERVSDLPVLAFVPTVGGRWKGREGVRSAEAVGFVSQPLMLESFRTLRSSLQYFGVSRNIKTILITSGLPREGKTVTSINLAISLALAGSRVALVEADLRRPMIPFYLNIDDEVGLSRVLAAGVDFKLAFKPVDLRDLVPKEVWEKTNDDDGYWLEHSLHCLASGPLPPNPAELLSSELMDKLLRNLSASTSFDYVIIDTPPVLSVADALVLAPKVDAVIVTTRMNWTTRGEVQEATAQLRRSGAHVIGIVASGVHPTRSAYYRKRGYYQYAG